MLLSTTPNIGNREFPLKRPKRVKELIHVWHSISDISYYKKGSLDNYDTVLTVGDFQNKSIRDIEGQRNLKFKKLTPVGLPYFDVFSKKFKDLRLTNHSILIASSWGNKGLLKNHGLEIIDILKDYNIIIRPHPQSFISEKDFIEKFKSICNGRSNIEWDECSDPLESFSKSKLMISDTSSIRYDYSFLVGNPVITIKIEKSKLNEFEASDLKESWDQKNQDQLGPVLSPDDLHNLLNFELKSSESIKSHSLKKETLHSIGSSSKLIVNYMNNHD